MQNQVQVPTIEELNKQLLQLTVQRAQAKDVVEQIERTMQVLQGQLGLLQAQAEAAKESQVDVD